MSNYDASIRVKTDIDSSQMQKLQIQINKTTEKVVSLSDKLEELKTKKVPTEEYQEISGQIEKTETELEKLIRKQDRWIDLGKNSGRVWEALQYDISMAKNTLSHAKGELQDLVNTGKAFSIGGDSKEISETANKLSYARAELQALNTRQQELINKQNESAYGFGTLEKSARKCLKTLQKDTKKSSGLLATMGTRLKGIAMSLLVFNWITKGFNAMVQAMKAGFQNLAKYSSEYNNTMSDLKSQLAQLKNSMAAAFEPLANIAIPYLTRLIGWLNVAMDKLAQFFALLQGKTTYTKAKKQTLDYAKSLEEVSDSAKGALASFDSLNVLNKDSGTTGAVSGEVTGAEAFEEAEINPDIQIALEKIKQLLDIILPLAAGIGIVFLTWKLSTFLKGLGVAASKITTICGIVLLLGGMILAVVSYFNMWKDGVDWGGIVGYIAGVALAIVGLKKLFGPLAAGIALIVAGAAGFILALKDISENGMNAQNVTLLIISAIGILAGVFMAFGSTAAVVVGGIIAVIAAIAAAIAIAGNGAEMIDTLKSMCSNFADFFKKIFTGDIEGALESLKNAVKDVANVIVIVVESVINCIIKGLNWLIGKINSISFDVPDWVPGIGGETISPNIPTVSEVSLPRLADGAVIQGGRPFAAILGDQRAGQTNIEAPLDTIKQAVAEVVGTKNFEPIVNVYLGNSQFNDYITEVGSRNALRSGGK